MRYVDAFLIPIPKKNLKAYKKMAQLGGKLWKKYGALEYMECVGDDLASKWSATFPKTIKVKPDEIVIVSFIVFKSRKHRDAVNAKVMKDPSMSEGAMKDKPMPFDMKRMAYGGFESMVDM